MSEQTISVPEAAERLRITTEEAYEFVFAGTLRTLESRTGRRVVPIEALEQLRNSERSADEPV